MPVPETHEGDHSEPSKRNYLLKADGSGTGTTDNPAQGAIGVVLRDPDGHLIAEISKPIGPAINTVAEYRALIEGLELARSWRIQRIRVFLDSELVVDQVNGRAKVGKEQIRPLHAEACSLLQEFPNNQDFVDSAKMECRSGRTCNQSASWSLSPALHTGLDRGLDFRFRVVGALSRPPGNGNASLSQALALTGIASNK